MRKTIALICSLILVVSMFVFPTAAADNPAAPEWLITEICANPEVYLADGTTNVGDIYEYIEIYNNSDKTLNLYDYCVTYNGTDATGAGFENAITEITPLGVYWLDVGAELATPYTIVGNMPEKNISDADGKSLSVKPGEVVVLWAINGDAYKEAVLGMVSVDDFRSFWKIDADTKIVAFDANTSSDKNFNIKNSATGTYGIAKYSEELNAIANVKGAGTYYPVGGYHESDEMVCWATVNGASAFLGCDGGKFPNNSTSVQFAYIAACGGKMYSYALEASTPGKLNDFQKAAVDAKGLNIGTAVSTVEEFEAISNTPGLYYLKNSIDFGGKKYERFVIENFAGVLDGNGYSIFNYVLENADDNAADSGTILYCGKAAEAVIANLFLGKAAQPLTVKFKSVADSKSFGVLFGSAPKAYSTLVRNVHIFANVTLDTANKFNIGGFVGYGRKISMLDCTMNGSIVAGNEASETYANVAGFVGSASNVDRCNYIRLTNNADITAVKSTSEARAAGIITYAGNTSTIVGCRNNGKISAGTLADTPASETALIAAGIIASYNGASPMILKNCINTGDIVSKGSVGGIKIGRAHV